MFLKSSYDLENIPFAEQQSFFRPHETDGVPSLWLLCTCYYMTFSSQKVEVRGGNFSCSFLRVSLRWGPRGMETMETKPCALDPQGVEAKLWGLRSRRGCPLDQEKGKCTVLSPGAQRFRKAAFSVLIHRLQWVHGSLVQEANLKCRCSSVNSELLLPFPCHCRGRWFSNI